MEEFRNYVVEETPPNSMDAAMRHAGPHHWRRGVVGPYTYRVKVHPNRSPDRICYGTISEFHLSDNRTGQEVFRHAACGDDTEYVDTPEIDFVIGAIVQFYWNGPPKYTPAEISDDRMESVKAQLLDHLGTIQDHFECEIDSLRKEAVSHDTLNRLDAALGHLLAATSSLGWLTESDLKEICEEIRDTGLSEENTEGDHDDV